MRGTRIRLICIFNFFLMLVFFPPGFSAIAAEEAVEIETQEDIKKPDKDTESSRDEDNQVVMNIGDMTVSAKKPVKRCADLPGSVDIIGAEEVQKQEADTALDILRIVPGFAVGDYNSGGVPNGFTMRGFGMGGHGKHTAITIDGIPSNYPFGPTDGAVDLNQLSVDDIESIEVVKGPIDARYGNWSRAGVIHFHTRQRGDFSTAKLAYGSFDTQKAFLSFGKEHFNNKFNQLYSVEISDTDGYRENSEYTRQNAYGKWFYRPGTDLQIGMILHAYNADWDAGGYLTQSQWDSDPEQSLVEGDGGYTDMNEVQLHVDWKINENMPMEIKFWYTEEEYSRFSTYSGNQTEGHFNHDVYGTLVNLGYDAYLAGSQTVRFDVGFDYRNYDTDEEKYNTTNRKRDSQSKDNDYNLSNLGVYAKANYDPFERLRLFVGCRFDTFDGEFTNRLTNATLNMRDYDIWTYTTGAIFTFLPNYSIYGNVGTGFQLPQNDAKYPADAPDESSFTQYEVGVKANPVKQIMLRYAYFQSKNDDEITGSYNSTTNEWVYTHEGESSRYGHEVEINFMPVENLQFFGAYTRQEATFEEGTKDGDWVPAVPEYILKLGFEYAFPFGTALRCWYNDVGKWYTRSDNTAEYDGYQVFDFKVSHQFSDGWAVAFDVKNLFDESYSEYVSNWSGSNQYAGSDGRYLQATLKYTF